MTSGLEAGWGKREDQRDWWWTFGRKERGRFRIAFFVDGLKYIGDSYEGKIG